MTISDDDLKRIRQMSEDELVRNAQTVDLAVLVETNLRLKNATGRLTWVLIWLTVVLVVVGGVPVIPVVKGWLEYHGAMTAACWNILGLILALIGVLLLFRYGIPYRVRTGGNSARLLEATDEK